MRGFIKLCVAFSICLVLVYIAGPYPAHPSYPPFTGNIHAEAIPLEAYIHNKENANGPLKPDNEARIIWFNDSTKQKTKFAIVYLHGFSASQEEGNPIHRWAAKKYGMNLYLSRLHDHGKISEEPLLNYNLDSLWKDTEEALLIGKQIGDSIIVMSTSTGGTLSTFLCSRHPEIKAQILMSPNIALADPQSWLLNNHWGLQIARRVLHGQYRYTQDTSMYYNRYWNGKYRIEALTRLEELIETTMSDQTFRSIFTPTLMMYYYQDASHHDDIVSIGAMKHMFNTLSTPANLKLDAPIFNAMTHAIGNGKKSHGIENIKKEVSSFIENQLGLK